MERPAVERVAVIEPVGGHGGMDLYDFGLCEGVGRAGADVALYTCDQTAAPSSDAFVCRRPFRRIFGEAPAWLRALRYLIGMGRALGAATSERRRVVHLHLFNVGWPQFITICAARMLLRRVVVTAHDVECFLASLDVRGLNRRAYGLAHRVIAHNDMSRRELVRRLGVCPSRIDVIPHGNFLRLAGDLPPQEEARKKLGLAREAKVLLFFGQIKEVKGLDVLLRAMPAILAQHPDTVLLIAGRAWRFDYQHYRRQMDALGVARHCVSHIRYIANEEVPIYYAASDAVVLPYRRIYQSGVVIMAMSYAKPVLVSDIPGMLEMVTEGETGFVFRDGDAADLARQACRMLADPAERGQVAARGLALMERDYDWNAIGEKTVASYRASTGVAA